MTAKEKIQVQLEFAEKKEKETTGTDAAEWSGYVQGLKYAKILMDEEQKSFDEFLNTSYLFHRR